MDTKTATASSLLTDGSPKDVLSYLLQHRFHNDAQATASFLLEILDHIPNVAEISAQIIDQEHNEEEQNTAEQKEQQFASMMGSIRVLPMDDRLQKSHGGKGRPSIADTSGSSDIVPYSKGDSQVEITTIEVTGLTPRSKFQLSMYEHGMILSKKQPQTQSSKSPLDKIIVPANRIERIVLFPKPEDCQGSIIKQRRTNTSCGKKTLDIPGSIILLLLQPERGSLQSASSPPTCYYKSKPLHQISFQLPTHQSDPLTLSPHKLQEACSFTLRSVCVDSYEQQWMTLFHQSLLGKGLECCRVLNPQYHTGGSGKRGGEKFTFRSNEGDGVGSRPSSAGMPFVKCYSGVNYGVLFLLEEGLLFFKPPRFVHRSKLHSISCGRGSGGSRYIDLVATLDTVFPPHSTITDDTSDDDNEEEEEDGKRETLEFQSIDRGELHVLNDYINAVLTKAMARDTADSSDDDFSETNTNRKNVGGDLSSDFSDDDDDDGGGDDAVVEVEVDRKGGGKRRGGTQRIASKEAQNATKLQLQNGTDQDGGREDDDDDDDSADYSDGSDEEDYDSSGDDDDEDESMETDEDDETPAKKRAKKR